jgi:hypothetical protein
MIAALRENTRGWEHDGHRWDHCGGGAMSPPAAPPKADSPVARSRGAAGLGLTLAPDPPSRAQEPGFTGTPRRLASRVSKLGFVLATLLAAAAIANPVNPVNRVKSGFRPRTNGRTSAARRRWPQPRPRHPPGVERDEERSLEDPHRRAGLVLGGGLGQPDLAHHRHAGRPRDVRDVRGAVGPGIGLLVWMWRGNAWLGAIMGAAMLLNMVAAAIAGFTLPIVLRWFKQDPAQASGVFVTTVTEVCGFFFFLGLATLMLPLISSVK